MRFSPMDPPEPAINQSGPDGWRALSKFTPARIALGRAGGSWRTETLLDFRLAHARARDAVLKPFQWEELEAGLRRSGFETFPLRTDATDRQIFLQRPDLGRRLSSASRQQLQEGARNWGKRDLAVLVSDGLSALAAESQIVPTLASLLPVLVRAGWTIFPVFIIPFARVKLQDEVGGLLQARHALILLGERPGLGSPDSLGAYFTHEPGPGKTDADRNCISNIRPAGLPPGLAAEKLGRLLLESARQGISGVALKDVASGGALPAIAAKRLGDTF
jgi:ethanolamine ammonia-lyase small subunit